MTRRPTSRVMIAAALVASLVALVPGAASAAEPDASKLSPAMAALLEEGYGDFPIEEVVAGHREGDLYYLAGIDGAIDLGLVQGLNAAGARVRFVFPEIGTVALASPGAAVAAVTSLPAVTRLEIDRIHDVQGVFTQALPASAFADQSRRGTGDIGADVLWEAGITGEGVTVGVADTGIDSTHPDLGSKIVAFNDCTQVLPSVLTAFEDIGECREQPGYDDNGHGSHVSGIAAGAGVGLLPAHLGALPGVAPGASLAGAKVCLAAGSCLNSSVMAGIRYLATDVSDGGAGADVVNVSLGSGRFVFSPVFPAEQVTNNDPEARLVNELATTYNVVFTISAGNSGPVLQSTGSPSVASQAISVGAAVTDWDLDHPVDETQHGELGEVRPEAASAGATAIASFSSRGPTGDRLIKPELTAPGAYFIAAESSEGAEVAAADLAHRHDYSADPTYAVLSGTSMSAPAAAGAAALVWDAYQEFVGADPRYFEVKAALANTAGTHAFEGPIVGLISGIRAKNLGDDPDELFPIRNADWVGVSGEGSGRINAPAAALAITQGVLAYTPQVGELDDIHELQPNWALDDVAPGESAVQPFVLHPGPGLRGARVTFSVDAGTEPEGVLAAPASWFKLARRPVRVHPGTDAHVQLKLEVPADAAPGTYAATIVGQARLDKQTVQNVRIPVQFFVPVVDDDPAEGAGVAVEGPIWASEPTDYSIPGFYNPLGDIFTDWATFPLRLTEGTQRVDLSVYDVEGLDHMDVFVFDENGVEVDSTVSFFLHHSVPGGALYAPTTADAPARISLFDGDDATDVVLPATVWIAVSDSGPDQLGFSTFHLDVDVLSDGTGGGTVPAERIHSGTHAWWSGSVNDADGTLTREVAVPAGAGELRFFTWYNLEEGFDWAYVLVSADGGATWTSLVTTAPNGSGTTTLDPMGDTGNVLGGSKRYPNGLTGVSGQPAFLSGGLLSPEMTEHTADLTPYEGGTVLLRFAYTSDGGVNLENIYVDDVSIVDASGTALFLDDMEEGGTWTSEGTPGWAWVTA